MLRRSITQLGAARASRAFSSHTALLREYASEGDWKRALQVMSELDKAGKTDALSYELAIEACGRDRRIDAMQALKDTMEKDKIVPSTGTIDLFVQLYMHLNQPEKLVELGIQRLRANEPMSLAAYHSMIDACCSLRSIPYAEEILQSLGEHAAWATPLGCDEFAALIRCFGICQRADFAMHALFTMQDRGIEPNVEVYTQLVRAHISLGGMNQALHVFSLCNQQGIVLGESIHAATIGALCEKKAFWLATELFADMEAKKVEASHYCLSKMILAYIRTNNRDGAYEIWRRIQSRDRPATIATYMGIMSDCVVTGELDILLLAFHELQSHYDVLPPAAYSFAIRAHGRKGNTADAIEMMEALIRANGCPQDATTYIAIFNALARSSVDRSVDQNRHDIVKYWDLMMRHVSNLQAPAFASAAGAFASCGDVDSLKKLIEHTKSHLPGSESLLYSGAISGFSKANADYTGYIRDCITEMLENGIALNDAAVRAASDAYVKHACWDDVAHLIKKMDPKAFNRPEGVIGDVISKLLDAQNWPVARFAINSAHAMHIDPHIRSKPYHLQVLANNTNESPEWRIAYSLALETVSFGTINEEHVYAVCNAMKVLFRAEKYNLMARLWYALKAKNQLPLPIDAYKCIVIASLESGFEHSAIMAADEMLAMFSEHHADIVDSTDVSDVFSVIISTFAQYKHDEVVLKLFEAMASFNLTPNAYAFVAALKAYSNLGRTDQIPTLLASFEECISASKYNVDELAEIFSSVISTAATAGDDALIIAMYEHMEAFDMTPNSYAYNAIIRAYSRRGSLDRVAAIQAAMTQDGKKVNDRVVESLLKSYILANDVTNVLATMQQFQFTGDRALLTFLQCNQPQPVVDFLKAQGHAHQKHGHIVERVSPAMQTSALKWLLKRGATMEAADACTFLLQNGYRVTGHVFETLLDQLSYHGAYDLGTALLDLYNEKRSYVKNTDSVVESTIILYSNGGKYDHIRDLLTSPRRLFDTNQYALGMGLCVDSGAHAHALAIFESLRHRFVEPNGQVFCLALESCMVLNKPDGARQILQDVARNRFDSKLQSELNRRLAFSLTPEARTIDPDLTDKVAKFALFLEDHGFPITKTFSDKLLMRPTSTYLDAPTRRRILSLARAKSEGGKYNTTKQSKKPTTVRPWWKGDASTWHSKAK
ncbi:hypothetical protein SDRG_00180 [Saprolegnia diclina VS20]|uniref:Pentacotripeptide-repeat region of PRORP domain-containing protein n=1 Tax=Saprolegnia diclina (strain VS20) TaxID=1156394 RepID=T0R7L4_SAPDV|nr:hypothetical protein SDRG_00180 [Saprolegnia diclina VS20]EQC42445.1 hypothetical protein SDRG_00180 [Saprolegnia diclina VS20]|eukprot:XP_008603868.1 hypothetical protein SDRG_00180 [Saprolegnia diclina VS20]